MSSTVQPAVSGVRMNAASVFCASTYSRGPAESPSSSSHDGNCLSMSATQTAT